MTEEQQSRGGELLQTATRLAGLLAALAAVVYGAGAIVVSLRLAFEHFPWSSIVAGLPRDFLISTGAGQVLLPALGVGLVYGVFRALRGDRGSAPKVHRWRDGRGGRLAWLRQFLLTLGLLLVPLLVILAVRGTKAVDDVDLPLATALLVLLALAAVAIQEGRAVLVRHIEARHGWNAARAAAAMASLYAAAALPAVILSSSATPFSSAKICMEGGAEEVGKLIGEAGDRVYLGEDASNPEKREHRRVLVIQTSRIEQLFVGPNPTGAVCDS